MTIARIREVESGLALCWALAAFDLVLGAFACLFPRYYAGLIHPYLDAPQLDLIHRMGVVWLAMAFVAARAATCPPQRRALNFTVLAAFRLVEVPADVVYASVAQGAGTLGLAILWASPVVNLAASGFLFHCAYQLEHAVGPVPPASDPAEPSDEAR